MEAEAATRTVSVTEEASSLDRSRNVNEETKEAEQQEISLVDIHRKVLAQLVPKTPRSTESETTIESLKHRLNTLKRKRIHLESQLERKRVSVTTVSEELLQSHEDSQHQQSSTASRNCNTSETNNEFLVAEQRLALRTKRRIAGSHRLAGISVVPCDDDVLGIRLDICVAGRYIRRYYLFFQQEQQKVDNSSTESLHENDSKNAEQEEGSTSHTQQSRSSPQLKLVQHTLPQGVLDSLDGRTLRLSLDTLQKYIGDAYDACYNHAIRQVAIDFLKSQETDTGITFVDSSNTMDCVMFRLECGDSQLKIQLKYSDPFSSLPTSVKVFHGTTPSPTSALPVNPFFNNGNVMEVSSDEDQDNGVVDIVRETFRSYSVQEAIPKVMDQLKTR